MKSTERMCWILCFFLLTGFARSSSAQNDGVQIAVRSPDNEGKVYLTWAPVEAWARLAEPAESDVKVVLTNDAGSPEKIPCRDQRVDGDLAFSAAAPPPGETATEQQLELVLPKNGDAVRFYLAGSFPQASTEDEDAIIEVHRDDATGPVIGRRKLMVRIRKEVKCLTDDELQRFLDGFAILHFDQNDYLPFVGIHNWAARGKRGAVFEQPFPEYPGARYPFPDQAHGGPIGPAFLPWHRAFLLQFERRLQEIEPGLALPYWSVNQKNSDTGVFEERTFGANPSSGGTVVPTFSSGHPFALWSMPKADDPSIWESIQRTARDRDQIGNFLPDSEIFREEEFPLFAQVFESNPHNNGHVWTGPWMANCRISPRDPIFWIFHAWFDETWAEWQYRFDRFGSTDKDYAPRGSFSPSPLTVPIGHFSDDTMWPWNEVTGPPGEPSTDPPDEVYFESRPPVSLTGPFAASGVSGVWPEEPAQPTPGDMVDYQGIVAGHLDQGFAYDSSPFGAVEGQAEDVGAEIEVFADPALSMAVRAEAGHKINLLADRDHVPAVLRVLRDQETPESLRIQALRQLTRAERPEALAEAVRLLNDGEDGGETLDTVAVAALNVLDMFVQLENSERQEARQALREALDDERPAVRAEAMAALAARKDSEAIRRLRDSLDEEGEVRFDHRSSILQLSTAAGAEGFDDIRPHLTSPDEEVRAAAASTLGADSRSRRHLVHLLKDPKQPESVRAAAISALLYHDPNFSQVAFGVIEDPLTSGGLRAQLLQGLRIHSSNLNPTGLSEAEREAIRQRLTDLD